MLTEYMARYQHISAKLLVWWFRRYVGENIHRDEVYWIAWQRMYWGGSQRGGQWPMIPTPDRERSVDYMHGPLLWRDISEHNQTLLVMR